MSTEPYVPSEASFLAAYRSAAARLADAPNFAESTAEAQRGIAKIKADALREVASDLAANIDKAPNKTQRRQMQYAISMLGGRATRMDYHARKLQEEA